MNLNAELPENREERAPIDWTNLWRSPAAPVWLFLVIAVGVCFWPLVKTLPATWMSEDGYYSHGFLVPPIAAYVVYRWWPRLREIPVRVSWWGFAASLVVLYFTWAGGVADLRWVLSFCLVAMLITGTWFVAGGQWARSMILPYAYLLFALPIWTFAIDLYTAPLQRLSTQVSFFMLKLAGFGPTMLDPVNIGLPNFNFEVAVACSGFKLLTAVSAFTAFFILIGRLRWWANLIMAALVLPLCLFINGLRVALIGVVGDSNGKAAASSFHNWSGYITLIVCFYLLFKFARWLGWKD